MPMPVLCKLRLGSYELEVSQLICHSLACGFRHIVLTSLVQQIAECLVFWIPLIMSVLERCQETDGEAYLYIFLRYMFHWKCLVDVVKCWFSFLDWVLWKVPVPSGIFQEWTKSRSLRCPQGIAPSVCHCRGIVPWRWPWRTDSRWMTPRASQPSPPMCTDGEWTWTPARL